MGKATAVSGPVRLRSWPIAVPLAIGLLFLVAAVALAGSTLVMLARTTATNAAYVGRVAHSGGSHGGTFLYPRFAFRSGPGKPVQFVTSASGSTAQPYADGETVRVHYDPAHPDKAVISSFWSLWSLWAGPAFLAVFGFGFTALPLGIVVAGKRYAKK